jgi:PhoPQ-activated pathogenicity-related protein
MKVTKDGKLKLAKNEKQIGSFVFKSEEHHVKITDINSNLSHRVSTSLNIGRMIEAALKDNMENWLHNYAAMVWNFSNIVTDEQFFLDIDKACVDCVNRHKEFYGIDEDITAEKDQEIIEEAKDVYDAIGDFKNENK